MNAHDDLEAYVLGALDPDESTAFERHLETCPACRAEAASYVGVVHALHALPVPAAPPGAPRVRSTRPAWIAAVAAAAIAGIVAGQRLAGSGSDAELAAIAQMVAERSQEVALAGPAARGRAIVGSARTAFVVEGLPAPPDGKGYQVWVRGASVRSPGMLHRTASGLEVLVVRGDALAGAQHVGITIEPAGGSPKRTGPPQVTGEVS